MTHPLQCKCGKIRGHLKTKGVTCRVVCYCASCQAFARFLGAEDQILDTQGGTEIVQTSQSRITITQGKEHLAAVRLSKKGILRWYAACCRTPIGNTLANHKVAFIGTIHAFLERPKIEADFEKNISYVNVDDAIGEPKPAKKGFFRAMRRFIWIFLGGRIGGGYKRSPLFNASGEPVVTPTVLTDEARKRYKYPQTPQA